MASLHKVVEQTKVVFKWGAIGVVLLTIAVVIFSYGKQALPKKPVPPSVGFGKLPVITFPESATKRALSYQIDTLAGVLPTTFPDRATAYILKTDQPNLLNFQKAQQKALSIGFSGKEQPVSDHVYNWNDSSPLNKELTMDTLTFNFQISSSVLDNPTLIENPISIPEASATSLAQTFFTQATSFPTDIDSTKTVTTNYVINNGSFVPANQNPAQVYWVDFFQKDINGLPVVYANPPHSTMNAAIGSVGGQGQILAATYFHQDVDVSNTTYPIKTVAEAYADLQQGNAYIASYTDDASTISIKNIYLAYYMGDQTQAYLLPVYVFTADNNFYAYIPAISSVWTQASAPEPAKSN